MPKLVAVKSHVPHAAKAASAAAHLASTTNARTSPHWIITHFLVVSSFLRRKSYTTSRHTQSRAYHQQQQQRKHHHRNRHNQHQKHQQHQHQHQLHHHRWLSLIMLLFAPSFLSTRQPLHCHAIGYSYARFVGPVSGPEHEIIVHDELNGGTRFDYVARPEYQFAYGVEDSETHVLQNRKETRNGDAVKGVYSVVDPDGTLRVVKYTADDANGFQAEVITDGVGTIHGQSDDADGGGGAGGLNVNNAANWHIKNGNAVAHSQDDAEDDDDGDESADDVSSKNDYEVYEENNEHEESDGDGDGDGDGDDVDVDKHAANSDASAEGSYETDGDDGGGNDDRNNSEEDDEYY